MIVLYESGFCPALRTAMNVETSSHPSRNAARLHWQSQAVLLLLVPTTAIWVTLVAGEAWNQHDPVLGQAAVFGVGLALLVFATRTATAGAALTGAILAAALYLQTPGWHTALWPLLVLLLLTFAATRFGRRRKEQMGIAESRRGRRASQVAANLGVAALAGIPLSEIHVFTPETFPQRAALVAMIAALAEATADTLSSELGQVLGGEPRLITSFRRVPVGTDGAISVLGTFIGILGAALIVAASIPALGVTRQEAVAALAGGIAGLLVDSLLGATVERRGWLNNDAVNALSTLAAALLAALAVR
jgi:uncharacterized protein (TIGR00297 family)